MPSVVIAAHNEERVIGRCLEALQGQTLAEPVSIVVSANGCTDRTAVAAARPGVTVIDRQEPGKAGALNAGDRVAIGYPRIYLDADIVMPPGGLTAIMDRFGDASHPLAVVPARRLAVAGRPWPVRAYASINERLPAFRTGLFGRGMIALSEEGRARFDDFPDQTADDLFLDSLFSDAERAVSGDVVVSVEAPYTTGDLVRRLVRVRRGNAAMRSTAASAAGPAAVRRADRWAWLRDVVVPEPRLAPAAVAYVVLTVTAALLARRPAGAAEWGRDESTRTHAAYETDRGAMR
ncbi:glycosyltransferase [Agromyces sp. NPDC058136]|uniref:glycosyltransferase n=1 Tax=Agromyces sp. NPDC058136 TaxID=3346354 RepID=UPI0036DF490E